MLKNIFLKLKIRKYVSQTVFILSDIISVYLAIFIGLLTRFEWHIPDNYLRMAVIHGIYLSAIFIVIFFAFGLYRNLWEYAGTRQFLKLIGACIFGTLAITLIEILLPARLPLSVLAIQFLAFLLLTGGVRILYRIMRGMLKSKNYIFLQNKSLKVKVMIVGAGDAGSIIIREMFLHTDTNRVPVVAVDDDINKQGKNIHGVKIEYGTGKIPELVKKHNIHEIVFAIPSLDIENRRKILQICSQTRCDLKIMPLLSEIHDHKNLINILRNIEIGDLLGRKEVSLDMQSISGYLRNKVILITGGGGSIGSEIVRQIIKFHPKKIIIFDIYENSVSYLLDELRIKYGSTIEVEVIIGSILDTGKLENVFLLNKPDVVFHAAAYKHVPLMETNPEEAVKNNVLGTLNTAQAANRHKVGRFVLISTDKAVNPTSVMGATKRIAELIIGSMDKNSETKFIAVRFGNVLASSGSVIPLFKKQIEAGGPVTITHPEIKRYFMTIPEAAKLVIQAGALGKGGEIFILDMGEMVKIIDLAKDLIRLSGFIPDEDIKIEILGLRPGEKMYEELTLTKENVSKTSHDKIFMEKSPDGISFEAVMQCIESLIKNIDNPESLREVILKLVPCYTYNKEQIFSRG